jgi:hypothetical protein
LNLLTSNAWQISGEQKKSKMQNERAAKLAELLPCWNLKSAKSFNLFVVLRKEALS